MLQHWLNGRGGGEVTYKKKHIKSFLLLFTQHDALN